MTDTSKEDQGQQELEQGKEVQDVDKEKEVVQEPEYNPEEDIARQSGWVPKDEWKGKPEEWRPAKEFNERGELFTRIKSQSKELAEMKQAMSMLVNQQSKQYLKGFEDAVAKLKRDRADAVAEGDLEKVVKISDMIDEVKEKHQEAVRVAKPQSPQQIQPSDTFKEWHSKNSWYMKDKELSDHAETIGEIFKRRNPETSEAEMLAFVERNVRKEFPDKFRKAPPSPDGDGNRSNSGRSGQSGGAKFSEVESNMTEDERSIMKTIMRSTKMSKEDYLRQYAEGR